jgi:hypothetical protein
MADIEKKDTEGLPESPQQMAAAMSKPRFNWKRMVFILIGLFLFFCR